MSADPGSECNNILDSMSFKVNNTASLICLRGKSEGTRATRRIWKEKIRWQYR